MASFLTVSKKLFKCFISHKLPVLRSSIPPAHIGESIEKVPPLPLPPPPPPQPPQYARRICFFSILIKYAQDLLTPKKNYFINNLSSAHTEVIASCKMSSYLLYRYIVNKWSNH